MKIKDGYKLRKMCGSSIVVAVGKASKEFNGMITLNETARTMWLLLENGAEFDELTKALTDEYDVSDELAREAAQSFIGKLTELEFLA